MSFINIHDLPEQWDLIIIGGGITGAGVFREATRTGLRVLLLEGMDFAWGTSSRSSKLVHGGLRYLKEGKFMLTKTSVEEREYLLQEAPGLVELLGFLMPVYENQTPGKTALSAGLTIYDILALEKQHSFHDLQDFIMLLPHITEEGLTGGFQFFDAQVDDARLVLRLIDEACADGGTALNYTRVTAIRRDAHGRVIGVEARDTEMQASRTFASSAVINATGSWAEELHPSPNSGTHLRPLRGSHLVFPAWALPVAQAVCIIHPQDHRPVFIIPWEGAVLFGTTDIDHANDISQEPAITSDEVAYLMDCLQAFFPSLDISLDDCLAAFAGIRPVVSEGKLLPSEESREHIVWVDEGLITITGGKLTTFRRMAWDALRAAEPFLPSIRIPDHATPVFFTPHKLPGAAHTLSQHMWRRLCGRYGEKARGIVWSATPEDCSLIPGTHTLWAEIVHAAQNEHVRHLDDLLLRRVRIGLTTPGGGSTFIPRIQKLCEAALPWDTQRWHEEITRYCDIINRAYSLPSRKITFPEKKKRFSVESLQHAFRRLFRR